MSDDDEQFVEEYVQMLVDVGALVLDGVSEDGEPIYVHDLEKTKEVAPEYYAAYMQSVAESLDSLVSAGLVNVTLNEDGEEVFYLADQSGGVEQTSTP